MKGTIFRSSTVLGGGGGLVFFGQPRKIKTDVSQMTVPSCFGLWWCQITWLKNENEKFNNVTESCGVLQSVNYGKCDVILVCWVVCPFSEPLRITKAAGLLSLRLFRRFVAKNKSLSNETIKLEPHIRNKAKCFVRNRPVSYLYWKANFQFPVIFQNGALLMCTPGRNSWSLGYFDKRMSQTWCVSNCEKKKPW